MSRRLTLLTLVCWSVAFLVVSVGVTVAQPGSDPVTTKNGKAKKNKAEQTEKADKWAMKLQSADPATAERWMAMKAEKETMKVEKQLLREQEKAHKMVLKAGDLLPPNKQDEEKPTPRPVVQRYGNLPKEIPAWWAEIDADQDVQLSLYEWRTAGRKVEDFVSLDQNGDGFLTVEEFLRSTKTDEPRKK